MAEATERAGEGAAPTGEVEEPPQTPGTSAPAAAAAEGKAEAEARQESEDEEDVFEVESILDSKIEGGEVLYRVRWKGYDSDGDTWEPEAHLDDCKEVLLEFKRKQMESKQKAAAKKETPPKTAPSEIEEGSGSSTKEETPQKKKKSKEEEDDDEEKQHDEKKKKSKSVKSKEKSKPEAEPPESPPPESKPKKRLSESKEDLSSKKPKKDDSKKSKKDEAKDTKGKGKEAPKEKKSKKSVGPDVSLKEDALSIGPEVETFSVSSDAVSEEREKAIPDEELKNQEMTPPHPAEENLFGGPVDEEMDDVKLKKKKKKHKKKNEDLREAVVEGHQEKKHLPKKQKSVEKVKDVPVPEKLLAPHKSSKLCVDDKVRRSLDALPESKEPKKGEIVKEKHKKKHEVEKAKDTKMLKTGKEPRPVYDAFTVTPEDREPSTESGRKESSDCRPSDDFNKELKTLAKERRRTQEEPDSWTLGASEGDQEVMDTSRMQESTVIEDKPQVCTMAMDLQLEWMTLEEFQRHLDGADEIIPKDPVPYSVLKEAVKNGDYTTVKYALNSKEEYNLEQEDLSGMTLVMMAAAAGQDDVLRLLIRKGAKINSKQKNGTTALIHAAEKNHLTTVSILLDAGAFVNLQQGTGETALMKACKKGNYDIARLLMEQGADCNVLSKHQGNALQFAKQSNNVLLYDLINGHLERLSRVVEDAIKDYFDARLVLLEPIFPITCHRLCEGPDFSLDFNYKPPYNIPEESGVLLFVFHANFFGKEVVVRLCGSCSVQAVVLNDKFQLPVFLDAHFIYSCSPVAGANKLFIRLSDVPTAKVKLLICAYRVQLH
ncbi:M-phase phosphoprotein 8 [Gastrophryne carolinensis]